MAILNIRQLADDVHARLRLRAAHNGRSMEAEARDILGRACAGDCLRAPEGGGHVSDAGDAGLTLTLSPRQAAAARDYATRHHTTLQDLIGQLLARELASDGAAWLTDLFARLDEAGGDSGGATWTRDELYRV